MALHSLKTVNPYFEHVWNGIKTFVLRENDRNFQVGDTVVLMEYFPRQPISFGREIVVVISYILHDSQLFEPDFVVFQFKVISRNE